MAIRPILIAPDKRLKTVANPVVEVDRRVRRLLDDMLETMYDAPGIGLAAPQVGVLDRVVVMDLADKDEERRPMRLVNPEILSASDETVVMNEGCLSLPEIYVDIARPAAVRVRYMDENGARLEIDAEGMLARCIQHEIDHLNGVLHVDYLSALKRGMILRKLDKQRKQTASG